MREEAKRHPKSKLVESFIKWSTWTWQGLCEASYSGCSHLKFKKFAHLGHSFCAMGQKSFTGSHQLLHHANGPFWLISFLISDSYCHSCLLGQSEAMPREGQKLNSVEQILVECLFGSRCDARFGNTRLNEVMNPTLKEITVCERWTHNTNE